MWEGIISGIFMVIVAIIEAIAYKERKRTKEFTEKMDLRSERRAEESMLSMQMMSATLQLSTVTANALTGGHNNGNVQAAKEAAEKVEREYREFLQRVASRAINK